jgi:hypothetical protein
LNDFQSHDFPFWGTDPFDAQGAGLELTSSASEMNIRGW